MYMLIMINVTWLIIMHFLRQFSGGASDALFVKETLLFAPGFTHLPHFPATTPVASHNCTKCLLFQLLYLPQAPSSFRLLDW